MIFLFAIIYAQDVSLVLKFHILPLRRIQFFSFKVLECQIFLKGRNSIRVTKVSDLELKGLLCPFAIKSVSYYHRGIIGFLFIWQQIVANEYHDNVVQIMVSLVGKEFYFSIPIVIKYNGKDISTLLISDADIRVKTIQMVYNFEDISFYLINEKLGKIELGGCDINNFMDDIVETLKENCDIIVNKDLYYLKKV